MQQRYGRTITFAGRTWAVKKSLSPVGPSVPDPAINNFSDMASDVWVDSAGLHLTIHNIGGVWYSSEVILLENLGYGTYAFKTNSRTDTMDQNAVLGMFTWDPDGDDENTGTSHQREIDIEDSRWGVSDGLNTQYVIQPYTVSGNRNQLTLPNLSANPALTRTLSWKPTLATFATLPGNQPSSVYLFATQDFTYSTNAALSHFVPGSGRENVHLNLWLNNASAPAAPSNGQPVEVIITDFEFTPLSPVTVATSVSPAAGGSISGGGMVNSGVSVTVKATPRPGYSFVNWTEGGNPVSGSASYKFNANGNRTLVANFFATRDLNGDGNSDLLFQNNLGQVAAWYMNGAGGITSTAYLATSALGDWKVKGVADLNGDGNADLVFQNDIGQIAVWYLNGSGMLTSTAILYSSRLGDWKVVGVGDLNRDGNADILFQNNVGQIAAWYLNGSGVTTSAAFLYSGGLGDWKVAGVADLNGDGNADILFQNNIGQIGVWYLNGNGVTTSTALLYSGGLGDWRVAGVADMNNDGNADILFQNTPGQIAVWYLNGAGVVTSSALLYGAGLGDWRVR